MVKDDGVLARIGKSHSEATNLFRIRSGAGNEEYRQKINAKSLKEGREIVYRAWADGSIPALNPEQLPEDYSAITDEQVLTYLPLLEGEKYSDAVNAFADNKSDVIASISDKGIRDYLARHPQIQEMNPNVDAILKAQESYEAIKQINAVAKEKGYASALKMLDEEQRELVTGLAASEIKKDIEKRYKTGALRSLAYEAAMSSFKAGLADSKYILGALNQLEEQVSKSVKEIEKRAGGDLRKSISKTLENMIDGNFEDAKKATGLVAQVYKFEEAVKEQESKDKKKAA